MHFSYTAARACHYTIEHERHARVQLNAVMNSFEAVIVCVGLKASCFADAQGKIRSQPSLHGAEAKQLLVLHAGA
jgi:hypothetical protein